MSTLIRGAIFVLDDNIDTEQTIPAEYLTLVPSKPEDYRKLGSYACPWEKSDQSLRQVVFLLMPVRQAQFLTRERREQGDKQG